MEDNRYCICMLYAVVDSNSVYTNEFTYHTGRIVDGTSLMCTAIKTKFYTMVEANAAANLIFELYPAVKQILLYHGVELLQTITRSKRYIL